eukprot:maker-scaffold430_size173499-snap-gene-0.47 protein:Tk07005 transcript:maker-scaffold430_size173499-snap-gene-0.47-mRNA-1 annotation:"sodium-dependent nutrient amino acid transporter 1-like isoform x1"
MLKFQYGQSEGASTSHLFHAGQDPSATASSRVRVRVESRRHRRQKSLAEQTGRFHQRMVPNFFEPVQALASRPTYPPPGDEWPIVPVGRRSVDLEQNPNSPSSVPTGEDLGSTRSAWGDRTEFMWTPGHEYSDIVTDDEQSLPTIGGGLQSLFGARTAGTSTLELIDLGLASTTSLDPRSPNSFSVRTLPPRIVRNSAWQFMFLTICLFTDMETLIGLPARIYFNGRGAFFLVYLVFLFSLTLSLAFFQCTVGQYHQDGLVKLFQESPIGIGLGLGVSTTLMLVANQKMMYLARTYQTLLPLLSGAFRDPVTCSEDVCVENQPQSLEIESNCLETTDLSSLDGQSCPETTTVRWSQLQDWTVFSSSSSSLDFGFIIHGGWFAVSLCSLFIILLLGMARLRRCLPIFLSIILALVLTLFIGVGGVISQDEFAHIFTFPFSAILDWNTWFLAAQSALVTGFFLSGVLFKLSSLNNRNAFFPKHLCVALVFHVFVLLVTYVFVSGMFEIYQRTSGEFLSTPSEIQVIFAFVPMVLDQFELSQAWSTCYTVLLVIGGISSLSMIGMCFCSTLHVQNHPLINQSWCKAALFCIVSSILCIPDIILPSQGIAETLYVILGHIILECLGLCQIGYFFHYGMTYVRENLKYLIGCPLPRWTLVSFLLFDFAVLLSLLIYNFFGSVATFLTTKTSLSWVGWVGNGFAGLAVLIMWTPVCLGLFHAKINRKSLHAVISAVKSLGSKDPTESANDCSRKSNFILWILNGRSLTIS